jgi:hypothetical protein
LRGVGCGDVDLSVFESKDEPGRWYRSPKHDCFIPPSIDNGANADTSKDMMIGTLTYLWYSKDINAVNRYIDYGVDHSWVLGEAINEVELATKCVMTPNLISLLYDIQEDLEGGELRATTTESFGVNTGFLAHLDVVHILLSGAVRGGITDGELKTLKTQANREPRNALFQAAYHAYTDGDQSIATELLLDEAHFPASTLPNNHAQHCTEYLYQRDDKPKDWEPCPNEKFEEFSGTDLVFAASIIDGSYLKQKD